MPYGKGTYGSRVGRPAKKKLHRKEYQRLLDSSPKTGGTLDRAVQRVEDLKATSKAHKKAKREKARDIVNSKFLGDTPEQRSRKKWMLSND